MAIERKEELELTPLQRMLGNITAGTLVILCGVFLLLCGLKLIPLKVTDILIASLLFTVGLTFLGSGLIQRNSISLWLAFVFIVPGIVEILARYSSLGYSNLYPLYIATPAVSSLITMFMSREWRDNLYVALTFGVVAAIFALQSSGLLGWSVVVPILVICVGGLVIFAAFKSRLSDKKALEEENRKLGKTKNA